MKPTSGNHNPGKPAEMSEQSQTGVLRRTLVKLREIGFFGLLGLIPKNARGLMESIVDKAYDRRHGVNTAGQTQLRELAIDSPNKELGIRYQPTTQKRLNAMFANLPRDLSKFSFVDFGSGRGRVIIHASEFNFERVIGVEFSEELHLSEKENLARLASGRRYKCKNVDSLHQDATEFELPDGPLVLYFFDPFRQTVMQRVLSNMKQSYLTRPRKIYMMYLGPFHEAMVMETGIFHRVEVPELPHEYSLQTQYKFVFFETRPETVS